MRTGVSGHVHANECKGLCVNLSLCACVCLTVFMHVVGPLCCAGLTFTELWERSGCALSSDSPPLTHSLRPEWISFADNGRWTTGYLRIQSCQINISGKRVFEASRNIPEQLLSCSLRERRIRRWLDGSMMGHNA